MALLIQRLFLITICSLLPLMIKGQDKNITSPIIFGDYDGYATFEFTQQGTDTVLNGDFSFKGPIIEQFSDTVKQFYAFEGTFSENDPVNDWQFDFTNVLSFNAASLQQNELMVSINAKHHTINGHFDTDKPLRWEHTLHTVTETKKDTSLTAVFYADDIDDFSIIELSTPEINFKGYLRGNFADSLWQWTNVSD